MKDNLPDTPQNIGILSSHSLHPPNCDPATIRGLKKSLNALIKWGTILEGLEELG